MGEENRPNKSYTLDAEHRSLELELARLRAQVDLTWSAELRHIRRLGIGDDVDVLEVGCGPGYVLERWQEAYPGARLTGLDLDPDMITRGRTLMFDSVHWMQGEAGRTGLDDESYDVVLSRFVWQHLADPAAAARETWRVLRPGGRTVVVDVDGAMWGVAHPTFPEVIPIHVKHGRAQAARGGDRLIGRRLYSLLVDAGFADVELDVVVVHSDQVGVEPFLPQLDPDRQKISERQGIVTESEMEVLREAHRKFLAAPDPYVLMVLFLATGRRPE